MDDFCVGAGHSEPISSNFRFVTDENTGLTWDMVALKEE